jgi:nucleotide-binding universal stress UspA family protein
MLNLKNVLVPIDSSELSLAAIPFAREFARQWNASVVLAQACGSEGAVNRATGRLEKLGATLDPVPARAVLGVGSPLEFLVELGEKTEKSLVVMATRGLRGAAREVLGSVAGQMVSQAHGPVLTIKRKDQRLLGRPEEAAGETAPRLRLRRIMALTDLSPDSMFAVDYAGAVARAFGSEILLLHVFEPGALELNTFRRRHSAQRFLEQIGRRVGIPADQVMLESGPVTRTIVHVAKAYEVDLLVQATRGRRLVAGLQLASTCRAVVRRAHCPVLTVKVPDPGVLGTMTELPPPESPSAGS